MLRLNSFTGKAFHFVPAICLTFFITSLLSAQDVDPSFSFGGELRARVRTFDNINFGDIDATSDTYVNLRGYLYGDLKINNYIGLHAQILSAATFGKNDLSASDEDLLAVGELYTDIRFGDLPVQLRIGRQSMGFGSGRLIGASDGPNVAKKYDGIRTTFSFEKVTGDFMLASIVNYKQGVLDDRIGKDKIAYGSYWAFGINDNQSFDIYFFGNSLKDVTFKETVADENRYSIGSRFVKTGSFNSDIEGMTQFGTYGDQKIFAYMFSASVGYNWDKTKLKPGVKISGSIFSGKRDSTDNRIEIFRPIYSRPPVNFMAPFGPSNIMLLIPEGSFEVTPDLKISLRYYWVWRLFKNDGLYNNQLSSMTRCSDSLDNDEGMFVTDGFNLQIAYNITESLNLGLIGGYFFPGKYIRNTGEGKTVKAGFVTFTYAF